METPMQKSNSKAVELLLTEQNDNLDENERIEAIKKNMEEQHQMVNEQKKEKTKAIQSKYATALSVPISFGTILHQVYYWYDAYLQLASRIREVRNAEIEITNRNNDMMYDFMKVLNRFVVNITGTITNSAFSTAFDIKNHMYKDEKLGQLMDMSSNLKNPINWAEIIFSNLQDKNALMHQALEVGQIMSQSLTQAELISTYGKDAFLSKTSEDILKQGISDIAFVMWERIEMWQFAMFAITIITLTLTLHFVRAYRKANPIPDEDFEVMQNNLTNAKASFNELQESARKSTRRPVARQLFSPSQMQYTPQAPATPTPKSKSKAKASTPKGKKPPSKPSPKTPTPAPAPAPAPAPVPAPAPAPVPAPAPAPEQETPDDDVINF